MNPRAPVVAGARPEIGKTQLACGPLRAARLHVRAVDAPKPVVSGFDEDDGAPAQGRQRRPAWRRASAAARRG
jgi:dethiobiotin synthetase